MERYETILRTAIERHSANNKVARGRVYRRARTALNDWFVDNPAPTNERMEYLLNLEAAIDSMEHKLKWMQVVH